MRLTNARVVLLKKREFADFPTLDSEFLPGHNCCSARNARAQATLEKQMAESLPARNRKIRLLTLRDVYRVTRLTKKDIEGLEKRKLIKSLVPGPNPLYSFEQLEQVIAGLTDQAIGMTDLESLRRRMRELRLMQSLSDQDLQLLFGIKRPRGGEDEEKEAA
jgi:hypothetical protein